MASVHCAMNALERVDQPPAPFLTEHWQARYFYEMPCGFFDTDLPLDMSGCVAAARHEARQAGHHLVACGDALATTSVLHGVMLVEIEPSGPPSERVVRIDSEVLAHTLPVTSAHPHSELFDLVRHAHDLGRDVSAVFVRYEPIQQHPDHLRATRVFAALREVHVAQPAP